MKKKKEIKPRTVEIPENVKVELDGSVFKVKGEKGELTRELHYPGVKAELGDSKVTFSTDLKTKQARSIVGTFSTHFANMIKGVTDGFTYKLKMVYSHFPITVKQNGDILEIQNFLGEKAPRKAKILGDSKVKIQKEEVEVEGIDKEDVAQTAANIETATRVKGRDIRIFQDGIYITSKGK
ncbi:MAG: 50S ribosomal protein L6 [Candidatus Undinarchaeales archaeon]